MTDDTKRVCKVCFQPYGRDSSHALAPVILPACGHTLCRSCASRIADRDPQYMVQCPLCKAISVEPTKPLLIRRIGTGTDITATGAERCPPAAAGDRSSSPPARVVFRERSLVDVERDGITVVTALYSSIEHGEIWRRRTNLADAIREADMARDDANQRVQGAVIAAPGMCQDRIQEYLRVLKLAMQKCNVHDVEACMRAVSTMLVHANRKKQLAFSYRTLPKRDAADLIMDLKRMHTSITSALDAIPAPSMMRVHPEDGGGSLEEMCIAAVGPGMIPLRIMYPGGCAGIAVGPDTTMHDVVVEFFRAIDETVTDPEYCKLCRTVDPADGSGSPTTVIDEKSTVAANKFREWDPLWIRCYERGFKITAMLLDGKPHDLRVTPDRMSGRYFKWLVHRINKVAPVDQQHLCEGRPIEDAGSLANYTVGGGSTTHMVMRLRGGKPVILFYPPTRTAEPIRGVTTEVAVNTSVGNALLTTLHPAPQVASPLQAVWSDVTVHPDGTVETPAGDKAAYLFWECDVNHAHCALGMEVLNNIETFCVPSRDISRFLDRQLGLLGLTIRERTDMITFWLADMQKNEYVLLHFIPQGAVDRSIALCVDAAIPVVVSRIYFAFQSITAAQAGRSQNWGRNVRPTIPGVSPIVRDPTKLTVVEWGAIHVK